ncbi:MAG: hypothetical protein ABL932_20830 [Terricaulis sp.]
MTMTAQEVRAALDIMHDSYSYEPSRWMPSYEALRVLEHEMREQMKPYEWIRALFGWLGISALLIGIAVLALSDPFSSRSIWLDALAFGAVFLIPSSIMSFGGWLTVRIAARRHPLVVFKSRVETATRRGPSFTPRADLKIHS